MKLLNGSELAEYVKERQARQVRGLRQHDKTIPRLAIVVANNDPVIDTYMRLKQNYAVDILIDVDIHKVLVGEVENKLDELNNNQSVKGIILQLPLSDALKTDELVAKIASEKDVDGLGPDSDFGSATAIAINWLLAGYNVELSGKKIVIIGRGRLVGGPLAKMWQDSGYDIEVLDKETLDIKSKTLSADIIVSATGVAGLLTSDMIQPGAVVVDAGTASENGQIVGDVADEVYDRDDITITPRRGGVGPLTIATLMDNVIRATRSSVKTD